MIVAVTGGMGFIGHSVVSRLQAMGHRVIAVDYWTDLIRRYESERLPILEEIYRTAPGIEMYQNPDEFLEWLTHSTPDVIVHLGAVVDTTDLGSRDLFYRNVGYTRELVRVANAGRTTPDVPGIVFASSASVYGANGFPNNVYGFSKCLGEKLCGETRGDLAVLRFFNVFGANEHHKGNMASVPFKLAECYRIGKVFDMHSMDAARDFVPVSTVVEKIAGYAGWFDTRRRDDHSACIHEIVDLGTGYVTTFADLDTYIMHATRNNFSLVKYVELPAHLVGRYQPYTCAGNRAKNAGHGSQSTRDAIEELYGKAL